MTKLTDTAILKDMLKNKKMILESIKIDHRVAIAIHNKECEMLINDINFLERKLEDESKISDDPMCAR